MNCAIIGMFIIAFFVLVLAPWSQGEYVEPYAEKPQASSQPKVEPIKKSRPVTNVLPIATAGCLQSNHHAETSEALASAANNVGQCSDARQPQRKRAEASRQYPCLDLADVSLLTALTMECAQTTFPEEFSRKKANNTANHSGLGIPS